MGLFFDWEVISRVAENVQFAIGDNHWGFLLWREIATFSRHTKAVRQQNKDTGSAEPVATFVVYNQA